jgi:hypothetical protein
LTADADAVGWQLVATVRQPAVMCHMCMIHSSCSKIAEAEAVVSVNKKKWLGMHVHVQLSLVELRGPPNPWLTVT